MPAKALTVMQLLPALNSGGVERGTIEVARELVQQGHRALVVSAGGRMQPQLDETGAEHITLPIGRKRLSTLRLVRPLRRLMQEHQVDIVHLRSRLPAWIGWLAWRGLPVAQRPHLITTVHGPYSVSRYSRIMTCGERVIATSETIRDYITDNYPDTDAEIIRLIYRGIDPAEFPYDYQPDAGWTTVWQQDHPQLEGGYLLTLPARITRWKGQSEFIDLIADLHRHGQTDVHGLIVGEAEPRRLNFLAELQQKVQRLGLQSHVHFIGHRADMREVMASSDLILSITNEPEAFGRTTVEALALGKPVVGYDHGGTGEILRALFPVGNIPVGDLGRAADAIIDIRQKHQRPPNSNPFTLQRMLDATLSVYREVTE